MLSGRRRGGAGLRKTRSLWRPERDSNPPALRAGSASARRSGVPSSPRRPEAAAAPWGCATARRRRPRWPGQALPRGPSQAVASQASRASRGNAEGGGKRADRPRPGSAAGMWAPPRCQSRREAGRLVVVDVEGIRRGHFCKWPPPPWHLGFGNPVRGLKGPSGGVTRPPGRRLYLSSL